jgi:hypothetical protein
MHLEDTLSSVGLCIALIWRSNIGTAAPLGRDPAVNFRSAGIFNRSVESSKPAKFAVFFVENGLWELLRSWINHPRINHNEAVGGAN